MRSSEASQTIAFILAVLVLGISSAADVPRYSTTVGSRIDPRGSKGAALSVHVDNDFARFGAKSYAINKINSVEVRERARDGTGGAVLCGALAALALLSAFGTLNSPQGGGSGMVGVAVVLSFFAYRLWEKSKIREYQLFLMTSSSEAQAFTSEDGAYVQDLRDQIETAMLHHSRLGIDR